jgi:quinohemoprotein ethanol dehydrogenase
VLTTAGGLLFQGYGQTTGRLTALSVTDGKILWTHRTPNGIQAVPVTYMVKGVQYVAVTTGNGFSPAAGDKDARVRTNGRMVVFRLNGTGTLPPDPEFAALPTPSDEKFSEAQIKEGQGKFNTYCSRCHGGNAINANVIPDVRRSAYVNDKDAWHAVVMEGALVDNGMIGWKSYISETDSENMRAFVHSAAVKLAAGGARNVDGVQGDGAAAHQ